MTSRNRLVTYVAAGMIVAAAATYIAVKGPGTLPPPGPPPHPPVPKRMVTTIKFDKYCKPSGFSKYSIHVDSGQKLISWWMDSVGAGWMTIDPPPGCQDIAILQFTPVGQHAYPSITVSACLPRTSIKWSTSAPGVMLNAYDASRSYENLAPLGTAGSTTPFTAILSGPNINDDVSLVPMLPGNLPFDTINWDEATQSWICKTSPTPANPSGISITVQVQ